MKNYIDMTDAEFAHFIKTASADELIKVFCEGKTHKQIEKDISRIEKIEGK